MNWRDRLLIGAAGLVIGTLLFFLGLSVGHDIAYSKISDLIKLKESYKELQLTYEVVSDVTKCESEYLHDAFNESGAYGIAQFKEATFYELAGRAKFKNVVWTNTGDQLTVLNWALENGYGYHWDCYGRRK